MKKYSYLIQVELSQEKLNELGRDDWELVSVVFEQVSSGGAYEKSKNVFYLRRENNGNQKWQR